MTKRIKTFSCH